MIGAAFLDHKVQPTWINLGSLLVIVRLQLISDHYYVLLTTTT